MIGFLTLCYFFYRPLLKVLHQEKSVTNTINYTKKCTIGLISNLITLDVPQMTNKQSIKIIWIINNVYFSEQKYIAFILLSNNYKWDSFSFIRIVQDIFLDVHKNGYILEDIVDQLQCQSCDR